jgi:hypothetical protein
VNAQPQADYEAEGPEACVGSSAIYWAGSGPRVHVVRRGAVSEQKPLEPESGTRESVVLEVLINAKAATAFGPSFDEMRRGADVLGDLDAATARVLDRLAGRGSRDTRPIGDHCDGLSAMAQRRKATSAETEAAWKVPPHIPVAEPEARI